MRTSRIQYRQLSWASISFGGTGCALDNMSYSWDSNHNKTSETISGTMAGYGFSISTGGYDSEDRLVSFNRDSGLTQSWNLSPVGDWDSVTTNGTAQTRTHGQTHELLTGGEQNVSTDVKGNITLIPSSLRSHASSLTSTLACGRDTAIHDQCERTLSPVDFFLQMIRF